VGAGGILVRAFNRPEPTWESSWEPRRIDGAPQKSRVQELILISCAPGVHVRESILNNGGYPVLI